MDKNNLVKRIGIELERHEDLQKTYFIQVKERRALEGQLSENKGVLEELNLLKPENKIYKSFGPILIKQNLEDSRQNVMKRIAYISNQLNIITNTLIKAENGIEKHREILQKLQKQYQLEMAMK